jgi:hypothetical protein
MVSEERNFESAVQEIIEQSQRKTGTKRALAGGAARTYADLLDELFFYYRESVRAAERGTSEG